METFPYRIKTIQREAALTSEGTNTAGRKVNRRRVGIGEHVGLDFKELGTKRGELIAG